MSKIKSLEEWSKKKIDPSWREVDRRRCTVPQALGFFEWFEDRLHDLCHYHDRAWGSRQLLRKLIADITMCYYMLVRGLIFLASAKHPNDFRDGFALIILAPVAYFHFNTIGFIWWIYKWTEKQIKERKLW